jgi:hypothetical protein
MKNCCVSVIMLSHNISPPEELVTPGKQVKAAPQLVVAVTLGARSAWFNGEWRWLRRRSSGAGLSNPLESVDPTFQKFDQMSAVAALSRWGVISARRWFSASVRSTACHLDVGPDAAHDRFHRDRASSTGSTNFEIACGGEVLRSGILATVYEVSSVLSPPGNIQGKQRLTVTFVIAKIVDAHVGKVTLLADTKVTDRNDGALTRRSLANPSQKVAILSNDIVVGFAGDTPESALKKLVELRGQSLEKIQEELLSFTAEMHKLASVSKSFLIVATRPTSRITVIRNGTQEDRTTIGTGWIGDPDAFNVFSGVYQSQAAQSMPANQRFFMSMVNLVGMEDVDSVGGYIVRATGNSKNPLRFCADRGIVLPGDLEATVSSHGRVSFDLQVSLAEGADATSHMRLPVPGTGRTYSCSGAIHSRGWHRVAAHA